MKALNKIFKAIPALTLAGLLLFGASCTSSKKSGCPGAISVVVGLLP